MRTRAKTLTVTVAMVTAFAILPTFGAAAAEPLEDGSYDVVIGESTYTVDVVEGAPTVEGTDGVEFTFAFDEETNRVLDEFDVSVDGVGYDVAVADDGTVTVTREESEPADDDEGEEPADDGESEGGEDVADGDDADGEDEEADGEVETLEEGDDDVEALEEGDETDDGAHGALVSTVAQCAPKGKEARAAGLPNHGFFVRAAAKGETVEFEAGGEAHSADLSSQEGADAFCALADELLAAAEVEPGTAAAEGDEDGAAQDAGAKGKGRGNGNGRANAPGQAKKNG